MGTIQVSFDGIFIRMQGSPHEDEKIERLRRAMYSRSLSPKLKDRPRRALGEDSSQVGEDWKRPEAGTKTSIVAPMGMRTARIVLRWFLFAAIAFFVGAAVFFTYYFTLGGGSLPASPGNIAVSISGPPNVAGGESTELQITVSNRNRSSLQLADLVITYPPGTRASSQTSTDAPSKRIQVGTLESGEARNIPVKAIFTGAEGQRAIVKVELEYRLQGSSAIFVTPAANFELAFSSSPISISIDGNNETVSGQPILLTLTVASNSATPIRDVLLSVGYPFGFKFSSAVPSPVRGGVWELGDIIPGKSVRIEIRGTLTGESGDERVFRTTLGTRKTKDSPNVDTALSLGSYRVTISRPFLALAVAVNKEDGANVTVAPGDRVNVSVLWQNNLPTAITDAVVVAQLSGVEIDGETVQSNDGFYRSSDNAVLWNKTTTSGALSNLAPGAKGTVNFSFLMPQSEILETLRNPRLIITVHASAKRLSEAGVPENLQATAAQIIKVASNLQVVAEGHYYDNPFGSVGPMPPKTGEETTYAILFTVTNTTNKIKNAKLAAHLPPYVRSLGFIPPFEKISFNKIDGTLTWDIGDIASSVGVRGNPPRWAAVNIGFTPSTSQIGQTPSILENISLTGLDEATGAPADVTAQDVTTNIEGDASFSSTNASVVR